MADGETWPTACRELAAATLLVVCTARTPDRSPRVVEAARLEPAEDGGWTLRLL